MTLFEQIDPVTAIWYLIAICVVILVFRFILRILSFFGSYSHSDLLEITTSPETHSRRPSKKISCKNCGGPNDSNDPNCCWCNRGLLS